MLEASNALIRVGVFTAGFKVGLQDTGDKDPPGQKAPLLTGLTLLASASWIGPVDHGAVLARLKLRT